LRINARTAVTVAVADEVFRSRQYATMNDVTRVESSCRTPESTGSGSQDRNVLACLPSRHTAAADVPRYRSSRWFRRRFSVIDGPSAGTHRFVADEARNRRELVQGVSRCRWPHCSAACSSSRSSRRWASVGLSIVEACQRLTQDPVRAAAVDADAILAQVKSEVTSLAHRCDASRCCLGQ
jgi:hypothetical protein